MTHDELDADDIERLTQGTLINDDVPDRYDDPSDQYESYLTTYNGGVMISEPEHSDTTFTLHPEGVPERGTPSIDFFYGRPVLYLYTPLAEEVQYMFALPTKADPQLRTLKTPTRYYETVRDRIENGYYEDQTNTGT